MTLFEAILGVAAFFGGFVASISGFGIGSFIMPVLASRIGMALAVPAVAIPHVSPRF